MRVNPQNAGPSPYVYYSEDSPVTPASLQLKDNTLETKALRVNFLVIDPSKQFETGNPVTWTNTLVLRTKLTENEDNRTVELFVAPKGTVKYTIDGSEPREGIPYLGAIKIENNDILLRAFAEAEGLETKNDFRFPSKGKKGLQIDPVKPAHLVSRSGRKLDSRAKTFKGLSRRERRQQHLKVSLLQLVRGISHRYKHR